ncbi:hypothetical protein EV356DRAFT_550690 [Viridothelium virens]|uniref:Uncharacterized protein n=1 Tax=Viridothelium virens TaxID=1048519 RepID=A0A6A6HKG7_VIRVR|nr:hypothetical protein EV356DRAFT_550690 [Viridothelium virens]
MQSIFLLRLGLACGFIAAAGAGRIFGLEYRMSSRLAIHLLNSYKVHYYYCPQYVSRFSATNLEAQDTQRKELRRSQDVRGLDRDEKPAWHLPTHCSQGPFEAACTGSYEDGIVEQRHLFGYVSSIWDGGLGWWLCEEVGPWASADLVGVDETGRTELPTAKGMDGFRSILSPSRVCTGFQRAIKRGMEYPPRLVPAGDFGRGCMDSRLLRTLGACVAGLSPTGC